MSGTTVNQQKLGWVGFIEGVEPLPNDSDNWDQNSISNHFFLQLPLLPLSFRKHPRNRHAPSRGDTLLIRGCGRTDFQQERAGVSSKLPSLL